MKMQMKLVLATLVTGVILAGLAGAAIVYFGAYNIAADVPHSWPMLGLMNATRARSVAVRSTGIQVPNLDDPQFVLKGAGQYAAMCTGCHLAPGMEDSEIRPGLYPQPQNLSTVRVGPREAFWIIKHGLKMTAMPAWGTSHDDEAIWSLVAFVRKLPDMTSQQYREFVAKAPPDDDMGPAPRRRASP